MTDVYKDGEYFYDDVGNCTNCPSPPNPGTPVGHYEYDANGNRTLYRPEIGPDVTGTYDAQDRM